MLDLREDAGFYVWKAVARHAAASCADASKVVLVLVDVASPPVATAVLQVIGFNHHLKERVIPADAPGIAPLFVPLGDIAIFWIEIAIAVFEERHQPFRRNACGHTIAVTGPDWWRGVHGGRREQKLHECRRNSQLALPGTLSGGFHFSGPWHWVCG